MLFLKNLTISASGKKIIDDLNYTFEKGKVYAVMGPNGSGKSTLAYAIMGHPSYEVKEPSQMLFNTEDIKELSSDKRAKKGIFLSFQSPLSLTGVTVFQFLRLALSGRKDPVAVRKEIQETAKKLHINPELLGRSLNEGSSGGERKKLEVLQAAVLDPQLLIFDEVDTGVDIDALKTIAEFIANNKKDKTYILITHYNRILRYIKPDKVLILKDGKLVKEGNSELAEKVEKKGYGNF